MSSGTESVSFTVRRPTPVSRAASFPALPRHLSTTNGTRASPLSRGSSSPGSKANSRTFHERDSSDEEDEQLEDELVTGFDQFGVQRFKEKKKEGPLVIAPLQNKDWREAARKRRGQSFVPDSGKATTGADGSVGGLGTRDTINSGPVLSGLQLKPKKARRHEDVVGDADDETPMEEKAGEKLTEEQAAIRSLLSQANSNIADDDGPVIDIIPMSSDSNRGPPVSEAEAFRQDMEELPDVATQDDYARVPVSQFGAAMLRGMGWKEGTAASRKGNKGPIEPYLPQSRPALLGIGAKEQEVYDDGDPKKKRKGKPDMKYMPLVRKEKEASDDSRERRRDGPEGVRSEESSRSRDRDPERRSDRRDDEQRGERRRDEDRYEDSRRRRRDDDDRRRDERHSDKGYSRERHEDRRRHGDNDDRDYGRRR